jgi:hypothetical protein
VSKLTDLVEHAKAPRTQIAAARALGQFARLELDEQKRLDAKTPAPQPTYDPGPDVRAILLETTAKEDESTIKTWKSQYTKIRPDTSQSESR